MSVRRVLLVVAVLAAVAAVGRVVTPSGAAVVPAADTRVSVFGVDVRGAASVPDGTFGTLATRATEAGVSWARYSDVQWALIEPAAGQWDTDRVKQYKQRVKTLVDNGFRPVVGVHTTPNWALPSDQQGLGCKPPADVGTFTSFMAKLVRAFAAADDGVGPVPVTYWQIWNEPDTAALYPGGIGCLGNPADPSYGGAAYAALLGAGAAGIRAANPDAKVVLGGLAFDCGDDPACTKRRFLDGVLAAGGAASFDVVDYHSYAFWSLPKDGGALVDWDAGTTFANLALIRATLARYGVSKPVVLGETALICWLCGHPPPAADQANYVVRVYSRAIANGLLAAQWYSLGGGGFDSDLLDAGLAGGPGYTALAFLSGKLTGATYAGRIGSDAVGGWAGYRFCKGTTEYGAYWTNNSAVPPVPLPAGATVYDKLGTVVSATTAGFEPVLTERTLSEPCTRRALWGFLGDERTPGPNNGLDLAAVDRYTAGNNGIPGPCAGREPGTCSFDTRSIVVRPNGHRLESITAYGRYWNFDSDDGYRLTPDSGSDLTSVDRYTAAGGPCAGRAAGTCVFDTRGHVGNLETITAYGRYFNFDRTSFTLVSTGDLTEIDRYRAADGPCTGKGPGTCVFDTRVVLDTVESITAYGRYFNYDRTSHVLTSSGDLTSVPRYATGDGPCVGKAPGTCVLGTRTVTVRDGVRVESITD